MSATLKEVASAAGVSMTTASRALAGYHDVAESTRIRVFAVAEELGYSPNITALRLRKRRTDTLGFIFPTPAPRFSDPFFSEFIAGMGNEAAARDYDLLVSTHSPDSDGEIQAYQRAINGGWVDGLVVVRTRENDRRIAMLCKNNFPFVAFGQTDDDCDFPFIDEDSTEGVRLIVEHFIDLGHRKIAFVKPPDGLMFGRHRLSGYRKAMKVFGLDVDPEWIVEGDLTQHGGADSIEPLLRLNPRPTAIIASNDLMAIGAIERLKQNGLQVGRDIAVGGFDDIPLAAFVNPPLTTVRQPIYDIGRDTCSMLIDIINNNPLDDDKRILKPQLIIRESSCPASNGRKEVRYDN